MMPSSSISKGIVLILFVVSLQCLSGSAFKKSTSRSSSTTPPPVVLPAESLKVPLFRQSTSYTCGVASLQSILYYFNVYDGREDTLASMCNTTASDGTWPESIVQVAQSFPNITAFMKTGSSLADLKASLAAGNPVILDMQAWYEGEDDTSPPPDWSSDWEDGHYVVLVGMDSDYIYIMDPSTGARYAYVPLEEFQKRWHDYNSLPDGQGRQEYVNLGIYISGPTHLKHYPADLEYMA
jgi:predicted double-glycine peptidase